MEEEKIKEYLRKNGGEFSRLEKKHKKLEDELHELGTRTFLTPEQERQENELKRQKLQIKDQMQKMIQEQRKAAK